MGTIGLLELVVILVVLFALAFGGGLALRATRGRNTPDAPPPRNDDPPRP